MLAVLVASKAFLFSYEMVEHVLLICKYKIGGCVYVFKYVYACMYMM